MSTKFQLKIFAQDGGHQVFTFRAPTGCKFTELGMQQQLGEFMCHFENEYPGANYHVVRTGKASFNALPSSAHA